MNLPKKRIYLDYAASTPVDERVLRAMKPYFSEKFGNPGSLHFFGQEAIAAVDRSRETVAKAIGAEFREVIFTGSATEANNLALRGAVRGAMSHELRTRSKPRIIISAIEHESVLETARDLERDGVEVVYLPVNKQGIINLKKLKESLNDRTVLISIMYANNEIGSIQPISEISKIVRNFREIRNKRLESRAKKSNLQPPTSNPYPFLHTDAAQAFQFLDCNVQNLGVDLMTLSAHKIYGPKGIGALYVRGSREEEMGRGKPLPSPFSFLPLLSGGGQEFGLRSGTENVPAIVGFAKAVELRGHLLIRTNERMRELRDYLWRGIRKIYPKAEINGINPTSMLPAERGSPEGRQPPISLPNILNVYFPNHAAQDLLTRFDLNGLAVSSGSACRSRAMESSYVIEALPSPVSRLPSRSKSSIRFSLGRPTTKREIDAAVGIIGDINH